LRARINSASSPLNESAEKNTKNHTKKQRMALAARILPLLQTFSATLSGSERERTPAARFFPMSPLHSADKNADAFTFPTLLHRLRRKSPILLFLHQ
jgi:hypothetical protein